MINEDVFYDNLSSHHSGIDSKINLLPEGNHGFHSPSFVTNILAFPNPISIFVCLFQVAIFEAMLRGVNIERQTLIPASLSSVSGTKIHEKPDLSFFYGNSKQDFKHELITT